MNHLKKIAHAAGIILLLACFMAVPPVYAKSKASVKYSITREENPKGSKNALILPYAFSTQSMGLTVGLGAAAKGYGQDQLLVGGTVYGSTDDAAGIALGLWDYQLPFTDRLYFTAIGSVGYYPRQRAYAYPSFLTDSTRFGSNDSDKDDYAETPGRDNWFDMKLEFVLPIGSASEKGMVDYRLRGGILQSEPSGGDTWNPLETGVTVLLLKQYNRYQNYETEEFGIIEGTIHPLQFGIYYNNTDFPANPAFGCAQFLSYTHDFAWLDSEEEWNFVEFEASRYFDLGSSDWSRQRILALNFWTGYSPSWEEEVDENGNIDISHRPPHFDGANLGGFYRLRGYENHRFNDRGVIYATAEYRHTLEWNPFEGVSWLRFLQTDWFQLVGFIEGGRVVNDYEFSELFSEWKGDIGIGIRTMMAGGVIRLDIAVSEEGANGWVMVGHPF